MIASTGTHTSTAPSAGPSAAAKAGPDGEPARPSPTRLNEPGPAETRRGTVVLVHGTMDRCTSFRRVAKHLPHWTALGWDRRGWGSSAVLGGAGTTLEHHVDDLCWILADHPGAVVAGHSYGGLVALIAAARRPDLVTAVVAFEPPIRWLPWWPPEAPWERLARTAPDPAAAAEALLRAVLGDDGWGRLHQNSRTKLVQEGPSLLTEMNDPAQDAPAFDPLQLQVPVVTAAGTDTLPHHLEISRRLAALVPLGEFVSIEGAGHSAHMSHPVAFAGLVERAIALGSER